MRAITVSADSRLELTEVPDPSPAHGEVVLDVAAAGLNRADVLQRAGHYPAPPGASDIIGLEVSGTVRELGEGVAGWQVGDRVCALLAGGGYAERVAVPAGQLLPVPAGMDLVDAAALPEAVCTAWSNLVDVGALRAGQTVLIHGGSGGVGSAAIQLSRALGARVLTTAGGPERAARCEELGADVAIDYHGDVPTAVDEATGGTGADVILDVLGAGGLADNIAMLATGGRLVVIGTQRGTRGEVDLMALMRKRASVHGTTLRARPLGEKAAIVTAVRERVWPMLEDGRLRAVVHERLPLAEAERAHELLDSGEVFGKLVLITGA
ncbi:NAD(P)H-quinone oxidoreductase [Georgenia satyanarayanai]|uniref:NAD(P)H-quinone oxidoreductase n=1 Tax=Georgenia satyanarayanai TaxID=860221 RepID=UPI00203C4E21|nr:NAD(P)H-quinone oxidoreductase [Georgenia satyanarayanai]MCM3661266.1 NAD(P)H-quinone oxidoreductase [Georgenia satyanarayanai]